MVCYLRECTHIYPLIFLFLVSLHLQNVIHNKRYTQQGRKHFAAFDSLHPGPSFYGQTTQSSVVTICYFRNCAQTIERFNTTEFGCLICKPYYIYMAFIGVCHKNCRSHITSKFQPVEIFCIYNSSPPPLPRNQYKISLKPAQQ
jgi:hypothetical protein